jgi:dihydrofolate synthase / folylpolyglutamate synthase
MEGDRATLAWLTDLRAGGSRLGIERMRALAGALGLAERMSGIPVLHVAGTNGKGSTCAMIEAAQRAQGRRTGLYTSPHLIRLGERIRIDGAPMSDADLLALAARIRPAAARLAAATPDLAPTFFELMTALALLAFAEAGVEVAILETGLGGRLDATNICQPVVTAITSIGLDHQEFLGDTLASIAAEKAGILKPGVPCVLGRLPAAAEAVIRARAAALGCPVQPAAPSDVDLPETGLAGLHQRVNGAVALRVCQLAAPRLPFDPAIARRALLRVDWPARWQRLALADGRTLVVDASHNEEGARALEPLLAGLGHPTVIVGTTGSGRARALLATVARHAGRLLLVEPSSERATPVAELARLLGPSACPAAPARVADLFPAPGVCAAPGETVVVVGSLYLAGEVLGRLHGVRPSLDWQDRLPPPR